MPSIIRLESVAFRYPEREIFSRLTLSLEEGEILGLIGPNSSGKTTLLKLMDGLLRPHQGKVFLEEKDLSKISRSQVARSIAVVPQTMEVPFSFTVGEIVLMGRGPYLGRFGWEQQKDLRIAREAMALTGVAGLEERPFWELSEGEKQRVLIARALAQEPKVILLDEPTSHLDINHQIEINELIRQLNLQKSLTVLNISHDLNLAAEYCHRIVLLRRGSVFSVGTPSTVITEENIRRVYETIVMVEKNPLSGAPRVTPIGRTRMEKNGRQETVHLICGEGSGVDSARRLLLRGYGVSLGVLNIGDTDQKIGKTLGLPMALEEPFSSISGRALEENRELIEKADLVVVERFHIGKGNLANLQEALEALEKGKRVIVLENNLEYDFTEGEAKGYYQRLREKGAAFIPDHSRLLEEVEKAVGAG
ncbi:MAG: ABC transporter ATP-binding protein [Thermodesulfobacteriota bacterium]|jgi:iron complex transport system ATP-binding protein